MDVLLLVQIFKAIVEIALMLLVARGVMVLFFMPAPHKLEGNFIYQLFYKGTQPLVRAVRLIAPRFVLDRHLPYAVFGLLLAVWVVLGMAKIQMCAEALERPACEQLAQHRAQKQVTPGAPR